MKQAQVLNKISMELFSILKLVKLDDIQGAEEEITTLIQYVMEKELGELAIMDQSTL